MSYLGYQTLLETCYFYKNVSMSDLDLLSIDLEFLQSKYMLYFYNNFGYNAPPS